MQPAVAAFTTACAYDRAGFGWSDAGPMPRTAGRIADELHALLGAANIAPPYVLVGHSFGGLSIRAYATSHPEDVAGLVFVDPAHPEDWREPSAADRERLQRGVALCRRGVVAARLGSPRWSRDWRRPARSIWRGASPPRSAGERCTGRTSRSSRR